ncbi:GDP-mannose 3,5-epimerase 2 [Glycine soja]
MVQLTKSNFREPINIGSDEMVSMNEMAEIIIGFENKNIHIHHIPGLEGVRGRNLDNTLIKEKLGWAPTMRLKIEKEKAQGTSWCLSFWFFHIGAAKGNDVETTAYYIGAATRNDVETEAYYIGGFTKMM